ncbi:MAG TPA: hypothetical protein VLA12_03525 [Planctomycetaceae bacterium]|nr:hypothetical protein [Planctomycetaceae bacterium]
MSRLLAAAVSAESEGELSIQRGQGLQASTESRMTESSVVVRTVERAAGLRRRIETYSNPATVPNTVT